MSSVWMFVFLLISVGIGILLCKGIQNKFGTSSVWNVVCPILIGAALCIRFDDPMTVIKGLIYSTILIWAANTDIHTHHASDNCSVIIAVSALICATARDLPGMLFGALFCFLPQILVNMILPDRAVGGADIKISTACGFLLGVTRGAAGLTLGLVFSVICSLITRKRKDEKLPLIPYLAAGFIPAYFI